MQFICKACKAVMRETLHFDYSNGVFEILLTCPAGCKRSTSHVAVNMKVAKVKLMLNSDPKSGERIPVNL
jgi:hypothetical protein